MKKIIRPEFPKIDFYFVWVWVQLHSVISFAVWILSFVYIQQVTIWWLWGTPIFIYFVVTASLAFLPVLTVAYFALILEKKFDERYNTDERSKFNSNNEDQEFTHSFSKTSISSLKKYKSMLKK
jgi:hypothetical protein